MVVVYEDRTRVDAAALDSQVPRNVAEGAILLVVQYREMATETYNQIGSPIIVVITGGAADTVRRRIETRLPCDVLELPTSQIVIETQAALWSVIDEQHIDSTITVVVEKTSAGSKLFLKEVSLDGSVLHFSGSDRTSLRYNPSLLCHIHELHLDLGAGL